MADTEHLNWLREGVDAWNARRLSNNFVPDLQGANLMRLNLTGANLIGANLTGAKLNGAKLGEANLSWADLVRANLSWTCLKEANLTEADLRGATLIKADLTEAQLMGCQVGSLKAECEVVNGSPWRVADLSSAIGMTQDQLTSMVGDKGTKLPEGLGRPLDWPHLDEEMTV